MWKPRSSKRQIYTPNPQRVCSVGLESGGGNFELRWRNPDSRLRLKATLLFAPEGTHNPYTLDITGSGFLWPYAADQTRLGGSTRLAPVTDLEEVAGVPVTRDAPLALPLSAGLLGYSREFVTAADFVVFLANIQPNGDCAGEWTVLGQWQPDGQRLPDDEWDEIRAQCDIAVVSADLWIPEGE